MNKTYLGKCSNYDIDRVEAVVRKAFDTLSIDIGKAVENKRVLLKPNLLAAYAPENAVTTHPVVLEAIIKILKDYNCQISIGDSPNGVQKSLEEVWEKTGMRKLCERYDVQMKYFEREGASVKDGLIVSNSVLEAEYLINVPKFKTHGLTVLTCAVKNMFGVVPGLKKTQYHRESQTKDAFARRLVKIAEARRPDLNIVDGIVGMGGNGPSGGFPVDIGLVVVGADMHLVDQLLTFMMGVDPRDIDTLVEAEKSGLINLNLKPEIFGSDISDFDMSQFKLPVTYTRNFRGSKWFYSFVNGLMNRVKIKPVVIKEKCIKCGMCKDICPIDNIVFKNGYPVIDYEKCIECYCCHEVCPENAMDLKESLLLKIFKRFRSK